MKTNEVAKIKQLLEDKSMTRRALAKSLDIDEAKLNMWVMRDSIPKNWIKPIAKQLGVTADYLLD